MDKKNIPLIIGLTLPLLVVCFVLFNYFIASSAFHPKHNFIYALNKYGNTHFLVKNQKIILKVDNDKNNRKDDPRLFIYNVIEEKSTPITFAEAQRYTLNSSVVSPDQYTIKSGYDMWRVPITIFFLLDNPGVHLQKGDVTKSINLPNSRYWDFEFIGWIINERK